MIVSGATLLQGPRQENQHAKNLKRVGMNSCPRTVAKLSQCVNALEHGHHGALCWHSDADSCIM